MYEEMTYEGLLRSMLSKAERDDPELRNRKEAVILYGLAPVAVEMKNLYLALDNILDETFADTASRECLIRRAAERGLSPYPAQKAVARGTFSPPSLSLPVGTRFGRDGVYFRVMETEEDGVCRLECETPGEIGNLSPGALIPAEYIGGLGAISLTEILIPGSDEEETEAFRKRYFAGIETQAYGGNAADYKEKTGALPGVGGVKVEPVWNGGGTVRLVILDSAYHVPSQELVASVQEAIDPPDRQGEGVGIAPIGHTVTVQGAAGAAVSVQTTLTYCGDWSWEDIRPQAEAAVDEYFLELAKEWAQSEQLAVRISQIENRLLDLPGVLGIGGTTLNGAGENLVLDRYQIPVRGEIHG